MTNFEILVIILIVLVLIQTTALTYKNWSKLSRGSNTDVLVDTSVLMDGRIVGVAETGFLPGDLIIPRSVIGELQLLADNGDSDKRERARRGLDVVKALQSFDNVKVEILQDGSRANEGVDERLLTLAKKHGASICTIDYNLNKVAQVEGIIIHNINELAQQLRMAHLPGDTISIQLTTRGSDNHQAVGHLDDGTMVVVEHAKQLINQTVEVTIIRSLQTAAGRMMFAKLKNNDKITPAKKPIKAPEPKRKNLEKPQPPKNNSQKKSGDSRPPKRSRQTNEDRMVALMNKDAS